VGGANGKVRRLLRTGISYRYYRSSSLVHASLRVCEDRWLAEAKFCALNNGLVQLALILSPMMSTYEDSCLF
jgi:hypothetical protein